MFKPLLAPREDPLSYPDYFKKLRYPLLCSPKLDGVRCIIKNGIALSRTGKAIPSFQVQNDFNYLEGFDGELIIGDKTAINVFNKTQSHVMSRDKPGDLMFYIFDLTLENYLNASFEFRLNMAYRNLTTLYKDTPIEFRNATVLEHILINNEEDLLAYELSCLHQGYEGIMLRDPNAYYKQGRGTFNEGIIYKLKRFKDDEGVIVDFEEQLQNFNEQTKDELGYSKRSSHKENMKAAGTLGKFILEFNGEIIEVAAGKFSHYERKLIWENQEKYLGRLLKFRHFSYGVKDKPRFPRAIGFRDMIDI